MSLGAGRIWTVEEDNILLESRRHRETWQVIGRRLDRTAKACCARFAVLVRDSSLGGGYASEAIRMNTMELGNAIIDAQVRFANQKGLTLADAQKFLMGGNYCTPSASPFRTCSIQRLTNRIHRAVDIVDSVGNSDISPRIAA